MDDLSGSELSGHRLSKYGDHLPGSLALVTSGGIFAAQITRQIA